MKNDECQRLQSRIDELQAELDRVKAADNENPVFKPNRSDVYFYLNNLGGDHRGSNVCKSSHTVWGGESIAFRTHEAAEAWADAIKVMLELRVCDGVVPVNKAGSAWMVKSDCCYIPIAGKVDFVDTALNHCFSPTFCDQKSCEAAIRIIGNVRIIKAMETLAWRK